MDLDALSKILLTDLSNKLSKLDFKLQDALLSKKNIDDKLVEINDVLGEMIDVENKITKWQKMLSNVVRKDIEKIMNMESEKGQPDS